MPSVQANGITIEYELTGEGPPLLLIMGLGGQLIDWPDGFVELFVDEGFQVIRFDNRDSGLSTKFDWETPSRAKMILSYLLRRKPTAGYHIEQMADDAAGLLDALGIDTAHIVGASMGGMIAQSLAISHPQRVLSLTSIMSLTGDGKNGNISKKLLTRVLRMGVPTRETAVAAFVELSRMISGPGWDEQKARALAERSIERSYQPGGTSRQTAAISASPDRTAALANVTAPTLVIHGLLDPLVTPSGGVATALAIPGSRLVNYPDMAHDLPRKRWPEVVDAITENTRRPADVRLR